MRSQRSHTNAADIDIEYDNDIEYDIDIEYESEPDAACVRRKFIKQVFVFCFLAVSAANSKRNSRSGINRCGL